MGSLPRTEVILGTALVVLMAYVVVLSRYPFPWW